MNNAANYKNHTLVDNLLINLQNLLQTFLPAESLSRPNPSETVKEEKLSLKEKKLSANLMRINHVGELCAQALYLGQSLSAPPELKQIFQTAAREERDHLVWCKQRLHELESYTSYLNPLWFSGALVVGTMAGIVGREWSLGFLAETEQQVEAHLETHLARLPLKDHKSRAILATMQEEEVKHAATAMRLGAKKLPFPIPNLMRAMAKVMTALAYYV